MTFQRTLAIGLFGILCGTWVLIALQPTVRARPGGGGIGGGGGGSSAVGNSAVQNASPSFGRGTNSNSGVCIEGRDPWLGPIDGTGSDDALPLCGAQHGGGVECCSTCKIGDSGDGSQWSNDFANGLIDGRGGSSCSSCGSNVTGGGSQAWSKVQAKGVSRYWIPFNRANNASFSPGYYSQYDSQLDFFPDSENGNTIGFFDAMSQRIYRLVDGADGDTLDGIYKDLRNNSIKQLTLLDSSNATTSNVSSAVTAKIQYYDGFLETYQLIDLDPSTTATFFAGRLTKRTDRDGRDLTITYKTWTSTQITDSPARQWQIDTVTDTFGVTQTFTYGTAQVGGMWAVSRIDRNDGQYVTYAYTGNSLTTVANNTGTIASMSYGQDTVAQTATATINDVSMTRGRPLTYHLTNDYMTLTTSGQSAVINQPIGVHRMVVNPSSDVEWLLITPSNPSNPDRFIYLGGNLAHRKSIYEKSQTYDTWTYDSSGGGDLDGGTGMPIFYGVTGTLNPTVVGVVSSTTTAQLYNGTAPGIIDNRAIQYNYEYGASGRITKKTYAADSTFSSYAYNEFDQITRSRGRAGDITKFVYDTNGHLITKKTGIVEQAGADVQTADYSETTFEYYPSTHASKGLLKAVMGPLYSASSPTLHRTDYEYDSAGRLFKTTGPAATSGGARPVTQQTYSTAGNLYQVTDPEGHVTTFTYDAFGRKTMTTYPDGSTEQTLYGTPGTSNAGQVIKSKNRAGVVTTYSYHTSGALLQTVTAAALDANILDGQADDTIITDPNIKTTSTFTYLDGSTSLKTQSLVDGAKTDYVYDNNNRVLEVKQYPRTGVILTSKKNYVNNQLFYDEDPYGRRKYYGYRASDGTLIRTITCTVPEQTFASFAAVWSQTRDTAPNAKFIIHDAIRDAEGRLTQVFDGRGTETKYEYNSKGKEINKRVAFGTSIEARTQTIYDLAGNVTEVRTPRYFDSADTNGYNKSREQWTYNGRGLVATHTVSGGTTDAASESFTYDLHGHQATRTDFGGNVWTRLEDSCCDKQTASVDPFGHGTITNTDSLGRSVHTIQVSDVTTHLGSFANPTDAKTLSESTTRYDAAGRPSYQTRWLSARGAVDTTNPPIAGLNGVALSNGLTTQYLYDNNLADGVGLDSTSGVSVPKLGTGGTGNFSISLYNAITKLADTQANGGAGISFNTASPGKASVTINSEDEISFSITDAAGRTVMSGKLNNYRGSGATALNTLATWSTQLHDASTNISGYGTVLVTKSIDSLGNATKSWTDAAGRTLRSFDQLDNATVVTYDAGGNQLTVRDPNSVGADMVYDALGRNTQRTDTFGDVTKTEYDRAGNTVKQIDAKNKNTVIVYDSRNRRKSTSDRINAVTSFTYTPLGQLASLTDAESQATTYSYDARGSKLTETYPDHVAGSTVGATGYGIVSFVYDNAGRVLRKQDQAGDTVTYNYDLAGRMTSRNYRTLANSPSGTIADTDTFTFDRAGRMLTAASGRYANTVTYAYEPSGRKATEALTIASQTYTIGTEYNTRSELIKMTYPDGSISDRTYHATGALNQLKLDGNTISTRSYDNGRRMTTEVLGNGITETRTYRNDNLLSGISYSNTNIGNLSYTWDANKNKTSETIGGVMSGYGFTSAGTAYDDEDRLTGYAKASSTFTQSWSLTSVGDWNSVTTNGTAQSRTHGPTHELLTAGGSSVSTDVKGNMTVIPTNLREATASTPMNLGWDFDNKLKTVDIDNNSSTDVSFEYDALGRRIARTEGSNATVFVQADQQTIADYPRGGAPATATYRYVYASYIDEPVVRKATGTSGTTLYYHRNQQYSIYALTDSSGNVSERYAYTAYGQPTFLNASATVQTSSAAGNRYTYTSREWDQTNGLHHFRARWMSGLCGRFLTRDPIGYPAGMNLLAPGLAMKFVDPYGFKYTDPAGNTCDAKKTCNIWICAFCSTTPPFLQFFDGGVEVVGHGSFCWNCQRNYGDFETEPSMPDEEPWNTVVGDRLFKRGCVGLWPNGRQDDWDYQDKNCTHHSKVAAVCPETMVKIHNNAAAPEYKCRWKLLPDPENESEANCISWACRMYSGGGLPFPSDIVDPYVFCNDKQLPVVKRIPRLDWPYR